MPTGITLVSAVNLRGSATSAAMRVKIVKADSNHGANAPQNGRVYHARRHGSDDVARTNSTIRHRGLRLRLLSGSRRSLVAAALVMALACKGNGGQPTA